MKGEIAAARTLALEALQSADDLFAYAYGEGCRISDERMQTLAANAARKGVAARAALERLELDEVQGDSAAKARAATLDDLGVSEEEIL